MFCFNNMYFGANILPSNILPKSCVQMICSLALHGEDTQYKLRSATRLNYASVHEAIKQLLASRLIEQTRQETGPGPLPKRFFSLTLRGLATAFKTEGVSRHIDEVSEKWGHLLPLVLGKWAYFRSAGLEDEFIRAFRWVTQWILEWGYDKEAFATERFWYFIFQMTAGDAKLKWLRALRGDPELRQWAVEEMKEWLAEGRVFTKIHERSLEILEMPNEPDWNKVVNDLRFHAPKESKYSRLSDEDLEKLLSMR